MEKTAKEQKTEIIQALSKALEKNCESQNDVWNFIRAIQDISAFMEGQRWKFRDDLSFYIRHIKKELEQKPEHIVTLFDEMSDTVFESILLSGRSAEGLMIINSKEMTDNLNAIVDEFNS
jgi:hypothetical protein